MGKWRGLSGSYVRAPMDDSVMSPGVGPLQAASGTKTVLVTSKDGPAGGDECWSHHRIQPSSSPELPSLLSTTAGEYRRHYNEDNLPPVCNGNGRATSAADDIHDSATVALSGAMHGGRMFASTLEHEPEDEEDEEEGGGECCESNGSGGADGSAVACLGTRVPSCDLEEDELSDGEDYECGLGPCAPRWMQVFASKQAFLVVFCITWVLQGMYYTYFVSVITTIEKLFQIQSKTTGIIMSATEIGQIGSSLLLTYYGGQGHRPKWIAWGMVLFAVSSFTCSLPHFIFGEQLLHANGLLVSPLPEPRVHPPSNSLGQQHLSALAHNSTKSLAEQQWGVAPLPPNLCLASEESIQAAISTPAWLNVSSTVQAQAAARSGGEEACNDKEGRSSQRLHGKITTVVLAIFFVSLLGVGMGQTAVYTLGIPYIDDNVASRESPLYFAITIGVRILGPALGFILGSVCTLLYADLSVDPGITPTDPRWVGAWWLGLVMVAALLMLASCAMFMFPKKLRPARQVRSTTRNGSSSGVQPVATVSLQQHQQQQQQQRRTTPPPPRKETKKNPSLRDFPKAVKRLLKNDILMFRTASSVLHILPIAGLYTFLPKYLESQFRLAAHTANMISGVGGILVMGLGIIISGVFILRVKPNARWVAAWIAFTAVVYAFGMGVLMLIGCPMDDFAGLSTNHSSSGRPGSFEPVCEVSCECDRQKFSPICGRDGLTYYSACHAGCGNLTVVDGIIEYSECACIGTGSNYSSTPFPGSDPAWLQGATVGYCPLQCGNFVWYMLLFSLFVFVHSTSEVGSMLLILRCVDPRDKAMALGLIQFAIGLFGNVPCPIVYGAVVDSACLVWDMACGERGACWLYDADVFRMFFHGTTGAILLCAFFVDLIVWYKAGSINFAEEPGGGSGGAHEEELSPIAPDAGRPHSETSV